MKKKSVEVSLGGLSQKGFEFGEEVFDGIEIGRVGGQEEQGGTASFDGLAHAGHLVRTQVVGDDHISRRKGGSEDLANVFQKGRAVHRTVQKPGSAYAIGSQGGNESAGLPMPMGNLVHAAFSFLRAAVSPRQIGGNAGFIQKDQLAAFQCGLVLTPLFARRPHVFALLLAGVQRFF